MVRSAASDKVRGSATANSRFKRVVLIERPEQSGLLRFAGRTSVSGLMLIGFLDEFLSFHPELLVNVRQQ